MCFLFIVSGFPLVLEVFTSWAPSWLVDTIASFSFLTHFESISKGVLDLRDVGFFLGLIVVWLFATAIVIDMKKAS